MNKIYVGKTEIELPKKKGFLFIHDEVPTLPYSDVFDPKSSRFNPLKDINYRKAMDIVDIFDALFPRGDGTLTKDTGLDFIADALLPEKPKKRSRKPATLKTLVDAPGRNATTGHIWAYGKVKRITRSPVLKQILSSPTNFSFNHHPIILARVNRAELGDFDALALGLFLIANYKGQLVIPDYDFYARDMHMSLIRENRLVAGVRSLKRLPEALRDEVLLVEDKVARGTSYPDAVALAEAARLRPNPLIADNPFNRFIERCMDN